MTRERVRSQEVPGSDRSGSAEELLRTMSTWAEAWIPGDLVFDVDMRRRVLARVPETLARESRRRLGRALRLMAVAAVAVIVVGGMVVDLRAQMPPVVREAAGRRATPDVATAGAPVSAEATAGAVAPGAGVPAGATGLAMNAGKVAPSRVRLLPVLAPVGGQGGGAPEDGGGGGQPVPDQTGADGGGAGEPPPDDLHRDVLPPRVPTLTAAGVAGMRSDMQEVKLTEALTYAGRVAGEAVVVTDTGRVWRWVDGSLVGGENLLPAAEESGCLVPLPGREAAEAVWVDDGGTLRLNGHVASVSLSGRVHRLAPVAGEGGPAVILAAGTLRGDDGYQVGLWVLAWQHGSLEAEELDGPPGWESTRPQVIDLAAFRGDRGLTVYLTLQSGSRQTGYLGEGWNARLRWRRLADPVFRPGTAVASSASLMAGVDAAGRVALLEWVPRGGIAAWFRPGWYEVRQLSFPELGEALRSVHFFDPDGAGQEGLLLVGQGGRVGFVDASLIARR